ncbi:hypothetical protein FBEOM_14719 [Fusarium beomiforme]|uniref:Uncharacterized protein n=1 Tax=Fusarium beomiforme TaxID=44412 RepID=A0A9P5A327_9HYPO|nr:hypothetical protein FBEOM_14719 [Fusarium beomiforme]
MLESATHGRSFETEADLERALKDLKLRVEVDHCLCAPYDSIPQSSNDISAWGLRAYWMREEMSTSLIQRKELAFPALHVDDGRRQLKQYQREAHLDQLPACCRRGPTAHHLDLAEGVRRHAHAIMLARAHAEPPRLAHPLRRRRRG